jgi:hypothetical protein
MADAGSYPANGNGTMQMPVPTPLPKLQRGEKHLDATLLAILRERKLELSVLPGVPFN